MKMFDYSAVRNATSISGLLTITHVRSVILVNESGNGIDVTISYGKSLNTFISTNKTEIRFY